MAKKTVDSFGRPQNSTGFGNPVEPLPYKMAQDGDTIYVCFFNTPKRAIHRITSSGSEKTVEAAFGAWSDRARLTYRPVNDIMEVEI